MKLPIFLQDRTDLPPSAPYPAPPFADGGAFLVSRSKANAKLKFLACQSGLIAAQGVDTFFEFGLLQKGLHADNSRVIQKCLRDHKIPAFAAQRNKIQAHGAGRSGNAGAAVRLARENGGGDGKLAFRLGLLTRNSLGGQPGMT